MMMITTEPSTARGHTHINIQVQQSLDGARVKTSHIACNPHIPHDGAKIPGGVRPGLGNFYTEIAEQTSQ